jgi:hypothetical protein
MGGDMSTISASTTSTTAYVVTADTTGTLVLQTGATPTTAVTIDTSQNVGIGTGSPAYPLDVAGNLRSNSWIGRANGSAPSADCAIYRATDNTLGFSTASTERMRIDSSGNVGIGVTSPQGVLAIKAVSGNTNFSIESAASSRYFISVNNTSNFLAIGGNGGTAPSSGAINIDSSGNVGIGTSSPNAKLEVLSSTAGAEVSRFEGNYSASGTVNLTNWRRSGGAVASVMRYNDANTNMEFGTTTSHAQAFITGGTERMRIDTSGNLLVNQTSQTGAEKVGISFSRAGGWGLAIKNTSATSPSNATYVSFYYTSTNTGSINSTGTTTTYDSASDYRLKENIAPMTGALAKVTQLKPCTYTWKINGSVGQGFLAHELQEIVSDCVRGNKDDVYEDGSIKPQMIDTSFLVATLTAAIQELKAINDTQAETINALTARIVALESRGTV